MHIEFSHVPGSVRTDGSARRVPFSFNADDAARRLRLIEAAGFSRLLIDDAGGILANMDFAAFAARRTATLEIALAHWAGPIAPVVAANQLMELDRIAAGRLSLRITPALTGSQRDEPGQDGIALHGRADEYLTLLKRLWSNDRPFDFEGAHYGFRGGHVEAKGSRSLLPIRMSGLSGTALRVAGRHADVFELAPGTTGEVASTVQRVRAAAAEFGRADRIRFALPLWLGRHGDSAASFIRWEGSPASISRLIAPYARLGIAELVVSGLDSAAEIEAFGTRVAPVLREMAAEDWQTGHRPAQRAAAADRRTYLF